MAQNLCCNLEFLDEPGFYKDGDFNVRLENDILAVPRSTDSSDGHFLSFKLKKLALYKVELIEIELLTGKEITFINFYHSRCYRELLPYMSSEDEMPWLE